MARLGLTCGERGVGGGRRAWRNGRGIRRPQAGGKSRGLEAGSDRNMGRERPSLEPRALRARSAERAGLLAA